MNLPYKPLTPDELTACKRIMHVGNTALVKWHKQILHVNDWSNQKYSRRTFRQELFAALDQAEGAITLHGVAIPAEALGAIQRVRGIQDTVFFAFTRVVHKKAWSWSRRTVSGYPAFDDFQDDGCLAVIEAIYSFRRVKRKGHVQVVPLIAHVKKLVENAMVDCFNKAHPLSALTKRDRKLRQTLEDTARQMNAPHNLQELIDRMGLSEKHRRALEHALNGVVFASMLTPTEDDEDGDYTALGEPVIGEPNRDIAECVGELLKQIQLNAFEWAVVREAMEGDGKRGWQLRLSKEHHHCRTAAAVALGRIRARLEAAYAEQNGGAKLMKRKTA